MLSVTTLPPPSDLCDKSRSALLWSWEASKDTLPVGSTYNTSVECDYHKYSQYSVVNQWL